MEKQQLFDLLASLQQEVPMCNAVSVAINSGSGKGAASVLFITEFDSESDYQDYRTHPGHVRVVDALSDHLEPSTFVDFEGAITRFSGTKATL